MSRRQFVIGAPVVFSGAALSAACSTQDGAEGYEALAASTWRADVQAGVEGTALARELVRCATLAPSSHNTQCWSFEVGDKAITIRPDRARRCPAVDPDDHHLFVSLGCATENLVQAARARGLLAAPSFDTTREHVHVALAPAAAQASPLFEAIASRPCTRGDYDGVPLARDELALLQAAGSSDRVRLWLATDRPAMERALECIVQGNTAQLADPAFVNELKSWIRFNPQRCRAHARRAAQPELGQPVHPHLARRTGLRLVLHRPLRERQDRAAAAQFGGPGSVCGRGGRQGPLGGLARG